MLTHATRPWLRVASLRLTLLKQLGDEASRADLLHGIAILVLSCAAAAFTIFMHQYAWRFEIDGRWLFVKEGPLEQVTWIAALSGSALFAITGLRYWRQHVTHVHVALSLTFGAGALGLFAFGMEEISWTQTFARFDTPQSWAAINHQQETTLHNLLDRDSLERLSVVAGFASSAGGLAFFFIARVFPVRYISELAPHWSLVPFLVLLAFATMRTHSEVVEALLGLFSAFYGWLAYRAVVLQRLPS